jgi:Skp family chaperone for outer membrane proteins
MKKLKAIQKDLEDDERKLMPAQKQKKETDMNAKLDKLRKDYKHLEENLDIADREIDDQKVRVVGTLGGKRPVAAKLSEQREREAYEAEK